MKSIQLYRIYGTLGHELQPVYADAECCSPENPYELIEVDLPKGWEAYKNALGETLIESPDGTVYLVADCIKAVSDNPVLVWHDETDHTTTLKWRYKNNNVREIRNQRGLTLQELSAKTGVNIRQITKLEQGEINIENITAKNLMALAEGLGVAPQDLFL